MLHGGHAATGFATGAITAWGAHQLGAPIEALGYLGYAIAGAGAALLPDLDHDNAFFYNSAGELTGWTGETLQLLARVFYARTRRRHDHNGTGEHRGLLHTLLFAIIFAAAIAALALAPYAGAAVMLLLLINGLRSLAHTLRMTRHLRIRISGMPLPKQEQLGALFYATLFIALLILIGGPHVFGPLLGLVVFVGMITHNAGDSLTDGGIPWLAGIIAGQCKTCRAAGKKERCKMWRRYHIIPKWLTFSTGTDLGRAIERYLIALPSIATGTFVLAGCWGPDRVTFVLQQLGILIDTFTA